MDIRSQSNSIHFTNRALQFCEVQFCEAIRCSIALNAATGPGVNGAEGDQVRLID
jgi:hypothetical protein